MDEHRFLLKARDLAIKNGFANLSLKSLATELNVSITELQQYMPSELDLAKRLLGFERDAFATIFDEFNFDGVNAIDILLIVSEAIYKRFHNLSPAFTMELKTLYPEVYQEHLESRIDFIFEKIKINIEKGIAQGMYRDDLSIELLSRHYISRLIDLHNPHYFSYKAFSFELLFEVMFENFIHSIATHDGLNHFSMRTAELKSTGTVLTAKITG